MASYLADLALGGLVWIRRDVLGDWLDGVTTNDGGDAMAAVKSALGM